MSAPDSAAALAADAPWPELDRRFLQMDRQSAPPPFPLDVLPEPWRPWVEGHAQGSTCVDYVAQGLLAAVSAVCGSRIVVEVTPHWREPLVLWQALIGAPSTGKTPALAAARRLLGSLTAPADPLEGREQVPRGKLVLSSWQLDRGISCWHDEDGWLRELAREGRVRTFTIAGWSGASLHEEDIIDIGYGGMRWAESIFGTLPANRLAETLSAIDDALLSRFLYCWPVPRLEARLERLFDGERTRRLVQRLVDLPGTIREPFALGPGDAARERLEDLLPRLRAFMRDADGVQAAWIGKAAGNIVRLAGLLSLMDWATVDGEAPCRTVEEHHLERAHALWTDYYWPHAQAVFGEAPLTLAERRVRRVGQWLRRMRPETVSREEVRREALSQAVDADAAESVIERLEQQGVLRMLVPQRVGSRGPGRRRWAVNPQLWAKLRC
jgi:hypothetical protein